MHGVMRGMFPLQVIRYLRGSGLVERQAGEGEVGRGGVKGRNKAAESHTDLWENALFCGEHSRTKKYTYIGHNIQIYRKECSTSSMEQINMKKGGGHIAESIFTSEHLMRKPQPAIKFGLFESTNVIVTSVSLFKPKEPTQGETQSLKKTKKKTWKDKQ